jgi:hypothetical protein
MKLLTAKLTIETPRSWDLTDDELETILQAIDDSGLLGKLESAAQNLLSEICHGRVIVTLE